MLRVGIVKIDAAGFPDFFRVPALVGAGAVRAARFKTQADFPVFSLVLPHAAKANPVAEARLVVRVWIVAEVGIGIFIAQTQVAGQRQTIYAFAQTERLFIRS